jgi:ribokinase
VEPVIDWDVVVVGGINTDFLARGARLPRAGASLDADEFHSGPGGKGANAAVAAARLGARTAIIGRVGRDERGRALVASLAAEDVHVVPVEVDPRTPTGATVIHVDGAGEKQILAALGANLTLQVDQIDAAATVIQSARVLLMQLEVPVECVVAAALAAHAAGVCIVLDAGPPRALPEELIAICDVIRGNTSEIEALTGQSVGDLASAAVAARLLLARGAHAVVAGVDGGNLVAWNGGQEWLPELPVETVDATGSGDAFSATLAVALAEKRSLVDATRLASGAAALASTALGAQPGLPRRKELFSFVDDVVGTHSST